MAFVTDSLTELMGHGAPDEVYVVIIQTDTGGLDVEVWVNPHEAIERARTAARAYCRFREDYDDRSLPGYLFHASISCEGDYVAVVKRKLR